MQLTRRDLQAVETFLQTVYRQAGPGDSFDDWLELVVKGLGRLVPNTLTTYNEGTRSDPRLLPRKIISADFDVAQMARLWPYVSDVHPLIQFFIRKGSDGTARLSDRTRASKYHESKLYKEFYRLIDVEDVLATHFTLDDRSDLGLVLHRDGEFSDRELAIYDLLRPHLAQGFENARTIATVRHQARILRDAVEEASCGIVELTFDRRIQFATEFALNRIGQYFEPGVHGQRLPDALDLWVRHHDHRLRNVLDLPEPRNPLVVCRSGKRLLIRMVSVNEGVVLLIEEHLTSLQPSSLTALGISVREAEVLVHVAHGMTNGEVGTELSISARTVQAHLERIYRVLGVESRAGAVAKAFQVAGTACRVN